MVLSFFVSSKSPQSHSGHLPQFFCYVALFSENPILNCSKKTYEKCDPLVLVLIKEALLGVLGIRDNWANYLRDKGSKGSRNSK